MSTSILIYVLLGLILIILAWIVITEYRFKKFFVGTKASNLEEAIIEAGKQMKEIRESQIKINNHLVEVDKRLDGTIRNVKTIRFNPFDDAGSNQSFALAFLNDKGDGVVMSSLYARDRMSIFAKPIVNCKSEFELSHEEKEVLEKAI
jgi:hypothetical protein